jgi:hypothetical protein
MKKFTRKLPLFLVPLLLLLLLSSCMTTSSETKQPTEKSYTIGQLGPAKGLVFYDKGEYSDGWRYLELAPVSTELSLQWGVFETVVGGTSVALGEGKNNTTLIVNSRENTQRPYAAKYCDDLSINGFDDWFLPSQDELDFVYWRLASKGLGELKTVGFGYWSSSEYDETLAWGQGFNAGVKGKIEKRELFLVRAIRSF